MTEYISKWLDISLDCGLRECEFWDMTLAEVNRHIKSCNRLQKAKLKERATMDWLLADLIGRSVSRIYSSSAKMPDVIEAYPEIFKEDTEAIQEERERKQDELSVLRFKQFAQSFNKRFEGVAENK